MVSLQTYLPRHGTSAAGAARQEGEILIPRMANGSRLHSDQFHSKPTLAPIGEETLRLINLTTQPPLLPAEAAGSGGSCEFALEKPQKKQAQIRHSVPIESVLQI